MGIHDGNEPPRGGRRAPTSVDLYRSGSVEVVARPDAALDGEGDVAVSEDSIVFEVRGPNRLRRLAAPTRPRRWTLPFLRRSPERVLHRAIRLADTWAREGPGGDDGPGRVAEVLAQAFRQKRVRRAYAEVRALLSSGRRPPDPTRPL